MHRTSAPTTAPPSAHPFLSHLQCQRTPPPSRGSRAYKLATQSSQQAFALPEPLSAPLHATDKDDAALCSVRHRIEYKEAARSSWGEDIRRGRRLSRGHVTVRSIFPAPLSAVR